MLRFATLLSVSLKKFPWNFTFFASMIWLPDSFSTFILEHEQRFSWIYMLISTLHKLRELLFGMQISTLVDALEKYWPSFSCGSSSTCHGGRGSFWAHEVADGN